MFAIALLAGSYFACGTSASFADDPLSARELSRRSDSLSALLATYQLDDKLDAAGADVDGAPISDAKKAALDARRVLEEAGNLSDQGDVGPTEGFTVPGLLESESIPDGSTSIEQIAQSDLPTEPSLSIADVVASVYRSYPEIAAARQQLTVAGVICWQPMVPTTPSSKPIR